MPADTSTTAAHADEIQAGERFEFGENWRRFLTRLDDERIAEAEASLTRWLGLTSLEGKSFLDIGCGSGLFSLAARRLGAERVHSLDFDPASVACAAELRRRHFPDDERWTLQQANVLERAEIEALGSWDIVYSWGVLHHTGDMRTALANAAIPVVEAGQLYIAIYNDQGRTSRIWLRIKQLYNALPRHLRTPYALLVSLPREVRSFLIHLVTLRPLAYVDTWTQYKSARGMSRWHDLIDWVGGYPFEVAKPEEIFDFYRERGFQLERLYTCAGGLGCNQFVLRRISR